MAIATYKAVISTWLDTTEPADAMQITPTFHTKNPVGGDLTALANDLLNGWTTWLNTVYKGTQQRVTFYDVEGTKPVYPAAQVEKNTGVAIASQTNRDIAVCLSCYATNNRPRYRGRLYVPLVLSGGSPSGANVSTPTMTLIAGLVPLFEGLGGVDVDWGVYSRADGQFRKYTNWWIDNSWDTQRRRGKRATLRQQGTTSG